MNPTPDTDFAGRVGRYMDTAPFWQASGQGRLLLQFCTRSGRAQFYPRPTGIHSGRRSLEWREASGRASLVAWTVDRMSPATPGEPPRIQALVDLEEGVRLLTWLVDAQPGELVAGQPLALRWVPLSDVMQWPAFALAAPASP
jgi:uncharacterized OB-fold protein